MITKEQREVLKKSLKGHYVKGVQNILKKQNIQSREGRSYSASMIRNVFNGINGNFAIENAIIELYIHRTKEQKDFIKKRNALLGIE